jgi:hypothetical protein
MGDYYKSIKFSKKLREYEEKNTFFHGNIIVRYKEILLVINSIKIN